MVRIYMRDCRLLAESRENGIDGVKRVSMIKTPFILQRRSKGKSACCSRDESRSRLRSRRFFFSHYTKQHLFLMQVVIICQVFLILDKPDLQVYAVGDCLMDEVQGDKLTNFIEKVGVTAFCTIP